MKAFRIISTEHSANMPSVFLFVDGKYYGCMIYPRGNNYPQDINYWKVAEGSDKGRHFKIDEITISDEQLNAIQTSNDQRTTRELILGI